jgi:uroporphyrinogen-III decarboxylase
MSNRSGNSAEPDPTPEYLAREKRFNDAVALKQPDRVPIATMPISFMTRYAGLSDAEAFYDYERATAAWAQTTAALNFDITSSPMTLMPGPVMELLGFKTFKWPGHNLDDNLPYQFVENEYMTAEEYPAFLRDPSDFTLRTLMPRMAETLKPLAMLPPLFSFSNPFSLVAPFSQLAGAPPLVEMFKKIGRIGEEMGKFMRCQTDLTKKLFEMGYPTAFGAVTLCPFDWVSDYLRGMQGSMLDLFRAPDKLHAAMEVFIPAAIQSAVEQTRMTHNPRVFIPLHRGADGFMSKKQYAEFYWPGLKKLLLSLVDAGLVPIPFFEGNYTSRLEFLAELPPGKVAGHFDKVDKEKFKAVLGGVMCFWGDVPPGLLIVGTPAEVKNYVRSLIEMFASTGGLIVDGAVESIPAESRPENVEAMVEAVFEYGRH